MKKKKEKKSGRRSILVPEHTAQRYLAGTLSMYEGVRVVYKMSDIPVYIQTYIN